MNFNVDYDCDWFPLLGCWPEAVLLNCSQGALVEGLTAGSDDVNVSGNAIDRNSETDEDNAILGFMKQRTLKFRFYAGD